MAKQTKTLRARDAERGAALITAVLMATLLLLAGLALVAVTSTSAVNAADATAESQAYYAAEAGAQAVLGVLRGNSAPSPLFNSTASDDANKISFRKAVSAASSNTSGTGTPQLTRWLGYSATSSYGNSVVPVSPSYSASSGMAFAVDEVADPDNTDVVGFSTSGVLGTSPALPSGLSITYTPRTNAVVSTSTSGATNIGSFTLSVSGGNGVYTATNVPFTLTVSQTAPWVASKSIACTISGAVTKTGSNITGLLTVNFPATSFSLDGVNYTLSSTAPTLTNGSAVAVAVTVTPPEPQRLRVRVTGYGPRGAIKRMQMLVSRFAFDYNATSTIALRSAADGSVLTANIGSSSVYSYNGNDNANGPSLPAFTVSGAQDAAFINSINSANDNSSSSQVQGNPAPAQQVPVSSLDKFLQTTDGASGARATLDMLRASAKNQQTPGCSGTSDACDRYFASGETPSNIGAGSSDGLLTFVDGDYSMPPSGGAGLLVVTGTLTMSGNADFKGLILVLGDGHVERNGGGGDTSLGAIAVARFGATGDFLAPTFNVQGGGTSTIRYDSDWIRKALKTTGPAVLGISEYGP